MSGRTEVFFGMDAAFDHVLRKFGYLQNNGTSLWNVFPELRAKFPHGISIVEMRYQLS